jgi:hypothetical protein
MKNKQKLWRRAAHAMKIAMQKLGKHTKGARYGKAVRSHNQVRIIPGASFLFQRLAIRAGYMQGD